MENSGIVIQKDLDKLRLQFEQELKNFEQQITEKISKFDNKEFDYFNKLENLGFSSVEGVDSVKQKKQGFNDYKNIQKSYQEIVEFYKFNFPCNHVITLKDMITICEKYNLVFGRISIYKNLVPEKNLAEFEDFKNRLWKVLDKKEKQFLQNSETPLKEATSLDFTTGLYSSRKSEAIYYITAPKEHFKLTKYDKIIGTAIVNGDFGKSVKQVREERIANKLALRDPIIWLPVKFPMEGGACMITTKWGEEAEFPEFQNPATN